MSDVNNKHAADLQCIIESAQHPGIELDEAETLQWLSAMAAGASEDSDKEVNKYLTRDINYGKAARCMYNVFRLTGRYHEAAFVRELFDEPTSMLYQVWALIRTMDKCSQPAAGCPEGGCRNPG